MKNPEDREQRTEDRSQLSALRPPTSDLWTSLRPSLRPPTSVLRINLRPLDQPGHCQIAGLQ
jgi:hypothetical protein